MSSLNYKISTPTFNHNGLKVRSISNEAQLVRMTMAHMLFERQFYVDGQDSAKAISDLIPKVKPEFVAGLAKTARDKFKLRHVPLLLARTLAKTGKLKADDLADVIQRPDELGEFLSLYWKDGKQPLSNQVKKGLAKAFTKFNEYQLSKWDKNSAAVSLRDVLFLSHAKPSTPEQEALFKRVANKQLVTPDTWETELSAGADKKETFTRLMQEKKLGALAFLRNLRNMVQAGVPDELIRSYGASVNIERVLPFRFIAAARIVPQFEDMLEQMMFRCLEGHKKLAGKTLLLVDCSGSMFGTKVSAKSDLDRFDAAAALAVLCREVCESVEIFGFANSSVRVPPRRGFALIEAIKASTSGGTDLRTSLAAATTKVGNYDRVIVITDEQSLSSPVKLPNSKGYILNVAAYQNGLNLSDWVTISGWSEASLDFIQEHEANTAM
jgi:60 kDa SS-A/Ro ribonucleoprotein